MKISNKWNGSTIFESDHTARETVEAAHRMAANCGINAAQRLDSIGVDAGLSLNKTICE